MQLRNTTTGEVAPVHLIGTDEEGREIVQFVAGWEPVRDDGSPLSGGESDAIECDADGNYLL